MWSWSILMRLNLISKGDCYSVMNRLMNGLLISFGDEPPPVVAASRCLVGSPPPQLSFFFPSYIISPLLLFSPGFPSSLFHRPPPTQFLKRNGGKTRFQNDDTTTFTIITMAALINFSPSEVDRWTRSHSGIKAKKKP